MSDSKEYKETRTSWWGRRSAPPPDIEAYKSFPWIPMGICALVLPYYLLKLLGLHWMLYQNHPLVLFLIFYPIVAIPSALFLFAVFMLGWSRYLHPEATCESDKYLVFKDAALKAKYNGKTIPLEELLEAYIEQQVDIKGDLLTALYSRHEFTRPILTMGHVKFFIKGFIPELLTHSRAQDMDQVRDHYDRGDDFYRAFLGPMMVYTSGMFFDPENNSLEDAQTNKLNTVLNKIHLQKGERLLDLGCGWGTLLKHAAKEFGASCLGITLGKNQAAYCNKVLKEAGVDKVARAECMDYRDVPHTPDAEKFDKITCLEMSEHVGVKNYNAFCNQVSTMLKDDGLFYLQIAGLRRAWQYEDLNWGLFMAKYVFPGADASCPLAWVIDKLEGAGFEIHTVETIGVHYSATIKRWYDNWLTNEKSITKKYGARWFRKWSWFLAWSVITPEAGMASCYQIVAHKNKNKFDRKIFMDERSKYKI
jgi:cyclopropane fatty-acyl-phospholipid synthase-like methyltransferase